MKPRRLSAKPDTASVPVRTTTILLVCVSWLMQISLSDKNTMKGEPLARRYRLLSPAGKSMESTSFKTYTVSWLKDYLGHCKAESGFLLLNNFSKRFFKFYSRDSEYLKASTEVHRKPRIYSVQLWSITLSADNVQEASMDFTEHCKNTHLYPNTNQ